MAKEQPDVRFVVVAAGCGKYGPFADLDFDDVRNMVRLNDESYALTVNGQSIIIASGESPGFGMSDTGSCPSRIHWTISFPA